MSRIALKSRLLAVSFVLWLCVSGCVTTNPNTGESEMTTIGYVIFVAAVTLAIAVAVNNTDRPGNMWTP